MIRKISKVVPINFACRYFGISRSRYYQWAGRNSKTRFRKKEDIKREIQRVFDESKGTYGSPRIWQELRCSGIVVSENTVASYMQEMGLDARLKKKFRVMTTDSNHPFPVAERILRVEDHNTLPSKPGQILAGDITYLKLGDGHVYLAVVLDIFTREVVGWSMSRSLETKIVLDALQAAMDSTSPEAEVIFHSDRGSQYASQAYRNFLAHGSISQSMSRRGNCYDNSYVESWFGSFKKEWLYRRRYSNEEELRSLTFEYIEIWYNRKRRHSALGYQSPAKFRQLYPAVQ